ncbi:hypothetical protein TVAG_197870 [Trichomonas vaginalis G3]|uniref:Uncharacterized protein n=1 Tax=Trichomonas vaginalis (strain ATCC PRA-98 / G3) TaxID=412133 RepID=A2EJK4_TRIV3|nr:hypothetical protein TVAGG3_0617410 [Trichomonas vaginalis G3]EAY07174.1 hypothetical protein TVAG_197870 [Trichomonas vaginalis G3]KAI5503643.1 hypothetical protein TVAGG3_0617410 [Trichomonas vaginalis G3]|eukprot:XP_001319397.1 hypothetical protein [Trichomonas vaginalis G3]
MRSRGSGNWNPNSPYSPPRSGNHSPVRDLFRASSIYSPNGNSVHSEYRTTKKQSIKEKYTLPDEIIHRSKYKPVLNKSPVSSPSKGSPIKSRDSPYKQQQSPKLVVSLTERLKQNGVINDTRSSPNKRSEHMDPIERIRKLLEEIASDSDSDNVEDIIDSIHAVADGRMPKSSCKYFSNIDLPQTQYIPPKPKIENIQKETPPNNTPKSVQQSPATTKKYPPKKPLNNVIILGDSEDEIPDVVKRDIEDTLDVSPIKKSTTTQEKQAETVEKPQQKAPSPKQPHVSPKFNVGEDLYNQVSSSLKEDDVKSVNSQKSGKLSPGKRLYALSTGQPIEEEELPPVPLDNVVSFDNVEKPQDSHKDAIEEILNLDSVQDLESEREIRQRINKIMKENGDPTVEEEDEEEELHSQIQSPSPEEEEYVSSPPAPKFEKSSQIKPKVEYNSAEEIKGDLEINDMIEIKSQTEEESELDNDDLLEYADNIIHKVNPDKVEVEKEKIPEEDEVENNDDSDAINFVNGYIVNAPTVDDPTVGGKFVDEDEANNDDDKDFENILQKIKGKQETTEGNDETNTPKEDLPGNVPPKQEKEVKFEVPIKLDSKAYNNENNPTNDQEEDITRSKDEFVNDVIKSISQKVEEVIKEDDELAETEQKQDEEGIYVLNDKENEPFDEKISDAQIKDEIKYAQEDSIEEMNEEEEIKTTGKSGENVQQNIENKEEIKENIESTDNNNKEENNKHQNEEETKEDFGNKEEVIDHEEKVETIDGQSPKEEVPKEETINDQTLKEEEVLDQEEKEEVSNQIQGKEEEIKEEVIDNETSNQINEEKVEVEENKEEFPKEEEKVETIDDQTLKENKEEVIDQTKEEKEEIPHQEEKVETIDGQSPKEEEEVIDQIHEEKLEVVEKEEELPKQEEKEEVSNQTQENKEEVIDKIKEEKEEVEEKEETINGQTPKEEELSNQIEENKENVNETEETQLNEEQNGEVEEIPSEDDI